MMVIYGEYLFLENFITGMLLLILTAKLLGEKIRRWRLAAAASLCGAGGFLVFVPTIGTAGTAPPGEAAVSVPEAAASGTGAAAPWLPVLGNSEAGSLILALLPTVSGVAIRILMALLIPCLAFGAENLRILIKKGVIFLALTLLSGGAAMAFLLWQQIPAISGNGSIYIEAATYLQLLCWGVIAFGLVWWFVRLVRLLRLSRWTEGELQVQMQQDGPLHILHAAIDTGNCLREPISGSPVILLDRKAKQKMGIKTSIAASQYANRFTAVPYRAIGTTLGMLEGLRADEITFQNRTLRASVLAFYDGDFGDVEALVNREVIHDEILQTHTVGM